MQGVRSGTNKYYQASERLPQQLPVIRFELAHFSVNQYWRCCRTDHCVRRKIQKNIEKNNVPGLLFIQKLKPVTYTLDLHGIESFLWPGNSRYANMDAKETNQTKAFLEEGMNAKEKLLIQVLLLRMWNWLQGKMVLISPVAWMPPRMMCKDFRYWWHAQFVVPLVKAVQEQQTIIENQNKKIETQQQHLEQLSKLLQKMQEEIEMLKRK